MKSNLWNILKKELREMFRDKKSLAMMLVIPIFIPLIVIGMSAVFEGTMNMPITDYNTIGFDYELNNVEESIAQELQINPVYDTESRLEEKFLSGEIDLYVTKEGVVYTMHGSDTDTTQYASGLVESYFDAYKKYLQKDYLANHNVDADEVLDIIVLESDIGTEENFFVSYIISYAFLFIIMAITVSATYPATDTTAGEKERGTLETLLTFPIKSRDIIVGKFLSVTVASIITGLISLVLAVISLKVANGMFSIYEGVNLMLSPAALLYAVVVILAYSFLISGLCIAIASKSASFKEAQSALTPLIFVSLFPGLIAFMVGITTNNVTACIPFLNYSIIFSDIAGGYVNGLHILLMLVSTILIIAVVLRVIIKQYKSEKVLFG